MIEIRHVLGVGGRRLLEDRACLPESPPVFTFVPLKGVGAPIHEYDILVSRGQGPSAIECCRRWFSGSDSETAGR